MSLGGFGNYNYACRNIPSLPTCNLFFRQLFNNPAGLTAPATELLGLPPVSSPDFNSTLAGFGVGVNPACYIPRMAAAGGAPGSLGNIANIVLCGLSVLIALGLAVGAHRRTAAVGKAEMTILALVYAAVQVLQLLDTGAIFQAGGLPLTVISAVHLGLVVGFFWCLAWAAFLSLQVVEDGTVASVAPMLLIFFVLTGGSTYIFVDTALTITNFFQSNNPAQLRSVWLFVLTILWPAAAVLFYFIVQMGVVVRVLREKKPLLLFFGAISLFILSQGAYYALSYKICTGTRQKVDGSFLGTLLETGAMVVLFLAWQSITESSWDDFELS